MIGAIWSYLTAPENRDTLSWLGGGIAAIAAAVWTVIRFFVGRDASRSGAGARAAATKQELLADRGGITVGRDNNWRSGNTTTISTGVSSWQLVAVVAVLCGVALIAVSQVGGRVTAEGGSSAVGGDVKNSIIKTGQ